MFTLKVTPHGSCFESDGLLSDFLLFLVLLFVFTSYWLHHDTTLEYNFVKVNSYQWETGLWYCAKCRRQEKVWSPEVVTCPVNDFKSPFLSKNRLMYISFVRKIFLVWRLFFIVKLFLGIGLIEMIDLPFKRYTSTIFIIPRR